MSRHTISRRSAAAGGVAMLVLAAAAAGHAKAEELDGELLSATAEYLALRAKYLGHYRPIIRSEDEAASQLAWNDCEANLWPRESALIEDIIATPAHTPEGIRAKASALEALLNQDVPSFIDQSFDDAADDHEAMAMSLVRDVLGRAST